MKILVLVLCVSVVCLATPSPPKDFGTGLRKLKMSDKILLERQKNILRLFKNINQICSCKDELQIATTYSIEERSSDYTNSQVVKQFLTFYKQGLLPRDRIFSVLNEVHLKQAITLFKLFYYAKDWDTFYKTAVWARNHVNAGMFVYSLSVAMVFRADTYGLVVPAIYEVLPMAFFSSEVVQEAEVFKQKLKDSNEMQRHTIVSNYSGYYLNLHPEQSMSYYTEDIGLNAFYYYCNVYYPFWMDGEEFKLKNDRRGEQYYYLYQQLLARYYLERLSNDFGEIDMVYWDEPVKTGYYPSLTYPNGLEFPSRPNFAKLSEYFYNYGQSWSFKSRYGYSYTLVKDYERRIRDIIDWGYIPTKDGKQIELYTPEGFDILGNIIESNPCSPNTKYFGPLQIYARHLLGYAPQSLNNLDVAPSALEHFETASRDPVFYQFYKRIVLLFQRYKTNLPPYSYKEMSFPGVKVEKIDVDRLTTYFDYFDTDATNMVYLTPEELEKENVQIRVRQQRLNHKPFSFRINVNSETAQDAVVRVYLGPKYDEFGRKINMQENRLNFMELDQFIWQLKAGKNTIERNSRQFYWHIPDRTSYRDIYKKVLGALTDGEEVQLDASEAFYGFPNRLLLPKGKPNGQVFQMYVIVNPYKAPSFQQKKQETDYYFHRIGTGNNYVDNYAFGYPFDRLIDEYNFYVPNSAFRDVVIYHKSLDEVNSSQAQNEP
ncbi:hexamerin [Anoplophora glabripennis]|uniref:hexamerin n=1 Tax=Anoplophora glabripennis TaxID=217634 RepID=UPI0008743858|nr:hexamerin [Anoplophora glabripennis]